MVVITMHLCGDHDQEVAIYSWISISSMLGLIIDSTTIYGLIEDSA